VKTLYRPDTLRRAIAYVTLPIAAICACVAGTASPAVAADPPSFTFTADLPTTVHAGSVFTFPATVTDVGGPAVDYHTYFQLYDINFHFLSQTAFDNQTFFNGTTLNYTPSLTAPTTPGDYLTLTIMFVPNFDAPIAGQQFFGPFRVTAVPEPSTALPIGVALLCGLAVVRRTRRATAS